MAIFSVSNIIRTVDNVGAFESGTLREASPVFTYTLGVLTRVTYASGNFKQFTYVNSLLTQLDYVVGTATFRKTFNYTSGVLTSIVPTTL